MFSLLCRANPFVGDTEIGTANLPASLFVKSSINGDALCIKNKYINSAHREVRPPKQNNQL
jgi:hypothetical protein